MAKLKVTQKKGLVGLKQNQRDTLRSLGLKRINDVVVKEDRPEFRVERAARVHCAGLCQCTKRSRAP